MKKHQPPPPDRTQNPEPPPNESGEEQLNQALSAAGFGTWDVDLRRGTAIWNDAVFRALGYPSTPDGSANVEMWRSLVHPEDLPAAEEAFERARATRTRFVSEHRICRADTGEIRWNAVSGRFFYNADGEAVRLLGISFDGTDRKNVEASLRNAVERQGLLLRSIPMAFYSARATGDMETTWISEQVEVITGYAPGRFVEEVHFWSERLHPEDRARAVREYQDIVRTGSMTSEYRWRCADGTYRWFLDLGVVVPGGNGTDGQILGTWLDITARKMTEQAMADTQRRLTRLSECLVSFGSDPDENVNRLVALCGEELGATTALYNRLDGDLLVSVGRWHTASDFRPVDRADGHICHDVIVQHQNNVHVIRNLEKTRYADTDPTVRRYGLKTYVGKAVAFGGTFVGSLCVVYQRDFIPSEADTRLLGIAAAAIGVEETRKHAEDRIRMLAHTIRSIGELVSITDLENRLLFVNDAFLTTYGFNEEELIGKPVTIVRSRHDRATTQDDILAATKRGGWQGEILNVRKNGTDFLMSLSTSVVRDEHGKAIALVGIGQDITERRRGEEELRRVELRFRELFDENLAGIFVSKPDGRLIACNPAYARIFRFASVEEALTANATSLYPNPDVRRQFLERVRREKKLENYELHLIRRDGTPAYIVENILGKFDDQGNLVEIHGYLFDETKRRELEQQLLQSQKLQGVGTLAGGIAHDFNNLLGIIIGHTTILQEAAATTPTIAHRIDAIHQAAQRGASLVKQLLTFARKSEPLTEPVNLNDIVGEITRLLHETFPRTIAVTTHLDPALPHITADATQMHQVLLNLCVNARDAMPAGGRLTITSGTIHGTALVERFAAARAVDYVLLQVTDTGTGMDEAIRHRIFEPFFTTKGPGRGTGLGLSLVFGTVETHAGFIDVTSARDSGTTFSIYLPAAAVPAGARQKESPGVVADIPGGTETILLIEDEAMLGDLLETALLAKGYRVLRARDGQEGVQMFTRHRTDIDLVITDIGLPVLGGAEVFRRIRAEEAGAKVILASGYLDPDLKAELQQAGASHFVQKPYSVQGVLQTIRTVLNGE